MPGLLELQSELFYLVLTYVDPLDLIHLSKTNKAAHEAISQRRIWVDALKRTCLEAELFEPTYHPLHELDMETLKKACMGPTLMEKKLLNKGEDVSPARETLLGGVDMREFGYSIFHLIPGGRYILGPCSTRICLWDLGQPHSSSVSPAPPPLPPCSTLTPPEENRVFERVSEPVPHGTASLRFVGSVVEEADPTETNLRKVCIFEVGPLPENREIRIIAELALEVFDDCGLLNWICGDKAYICLQQKEEAEYHEDDEDRIVVWDFVNSRLTAWPVLGSPRFFSYMMNLGGYVLALDSSGAYAWEVPPLESIDRCNTLELDGNEVANEPTYIDYQDEGFTSWDTLLVPSRWYSTSTLAVLQCHNYKTQTRLCLGVVDGVLETRKSPCPPLLPLLEEIDTLRHDLIIPYLRSDRLQTVGTDSWNCFPRYHASFFASDFPAAEKGWKGSPFNVRADCTLWYSQVCPGSGRYAYTSRTGHGGYGDKVTHHLYVVHLLDL